MASSQKSTDNKSKKENFLERKEKFLAMGLEEKRQEYRCGKDFTILSSVPHWPDVLKKEFQRLPKIKSSKDSPKYEEDEEMNKKVSVCMGDITSLEVDAIVNAANASLLGGGGVDGAIHRAAGSDLTKECASLKGCAVGEAAITGGYKLPARYVIHTVGPKDSSESKLKRCYENCFLRFDEKSLNSIAFCCIATGVYGYPNSEAAKVAVACTRAYLSNLKRSNMERYRGIERVVFCLFLDKDLPHYLRHLLTHFPTPIHTIDQNSVSSIKPCSVNSNIDEDVEEDEDDDGQGKCTGDHDNDRS